MKLEDLNISLLCKWLRRLGLDDEWLWKKVLIEKYGIRDVWNPKEMHGPRGKGLWKGILRHMEFFKKGIRYEVRKGDRIGFWEDKWCGVRPLKEEFSNVYLMAVVADYAKLDFSEVLWQLILRRAAFDWGI